MSLPTEEVSWAAFPGAVQLPISEHLTHDGSSLAQPATVSRQCQDAIERLNFERITLTLWRMPEFEPMTRRSRAFIKCIRLNLEQEWDIPKPRSQKAPIRRTADDCASIKAMHDLFWILSTWKPEEKLRLEIAISSPSGSQQPGCNVDKLTSALADHTLEDVSREILGQQTCVFYNDEYEKAWWQTLPEAPAVRSLHLPTKDHPRWKQSTLQCLISRLPNLEKFYFEPNEEAISSQQIPATHAIQHKILAERLGVAASSVSTIHYGPSFSGKTWTQALTYYERTTEQYFFTPSKEYFEKYEFDPLRRPDH
ncbi:hypothetical protein F5X97DRAFT_319025 [Nemania serpens]|nr:hypothetical protein F5X97DRAFT_319025 [Nemania serpens]